MTAHRPRVALEIKGIALLTVIALLVWLSIALYEKAFTSEFAVTVTTKSAGLQLNKNGDVRMRGALIGRVTKIEDRGGAARIMLALDPKSARSIPADVEARILPTTLFGQKYVELVAPADDSGARIRAGAVIGEDRSAAATEITTALDHLGPVLEAIRPQDLSATLQAIADSLDGRGTQLGETVSQAASLVAAYRQNVPALVTDLRLFAGVTKTYAEVMPAVLATLGNLSDTSTTLVAKSGELRALLARFTELSNAARSLLDTNGDGLIEVNRTTAPVLDLLARYAPELPCLLRGLIIANKTFGSAFSGGKLHSYTALGLQYPAYTAADRPAFGQPPAPTCAGLPEISGAVIPPQFVDGGSHPAGQVAVP